VTVDCISGALPRNRRACDMTLNLDPRDAIYLARQPLFDRADHVFGYALRYRAAAGQAGDGASEDVASARLLTDAFLVLGLDTVTLGRPAFFSLSRRVLLSCAGTMLPPQAAVLELREDMEGDTEVLEACRTLHALGYALALDDFAPDSVPDRLLALVQYVRVDVRAVPRSARVEIAKRLSPRGIRLIAAHVDTADLALAAREDGYDLVQGFYFCRPSVLSSRTIPARRLAYLQLLSALADPKLSIVRLEELVKHDASLTYRVLRCVNSAAFAVQREIRSIREALVLLGLEQIRKWASVWAIAGVNAGGPSELAALALVRARCCELVGAAHSEAQGAELFLLGLCSLLDAMLGQPLERVASQLPLCETVRSALLGRPGPLRSILDAVVAYERGEWETADEALARAGVPAGTLPVAYADSLKWARTLSQHAAAA